MKPNVKKLLIILGIVFTCPALWAQVDSIFLEAHPDTLYAPEANGYLVSLVANDFCLNTETGESPIDCGSISIFTVDASAADGLGIVNWDATTLTFEPNALWLSLDTAIYIPYTAINAGMQTASSFLVIATDPVIPPLPITICCVQDPCPGELICNPEFSLPTPCDAFYAGNSYLDVDNTALFPCWRSIVGTPNGNFGVIPGQGECGIIAMWAANGSTGEGMQSPVNVVGAGGQRFLLSYKSRRGGTGASLDNFIFGLSNGLLNAIPAVLPYLIYNQQNTTSLAISETVVCFTPGANFNNLVIYPRQTNAGQPNMALYNIHLQEFPAASSTVFVDCGFDATLSLPDICIPGATWNWFNANGTPLATNTSSVTVTPTIPNQQYTAILSLPGNVNQVNCGNLTVTFTVVTVGDCCCDDFYDEFSGIGFNVIPGPSYQLCAPNNILPTDWLTWTFGDGSPQLPPVSGLVPCVFHNYPPAPGAYLATLTILRPFSDGDTCSIQLCELVEVPITCADCEDHLIQISNQIDLAVDISNWTPSGGPINFYPVPVFAPYNVRVLWDFDCDGNIDQITLGNDPASFNYSCGVQTVCYTVECQLSQNTSCYSESHVKDFILPCGIGDFCCADFMTDVMDYGIQQIYLGGNSYDFCLSPNIPAGSLIDWDLNCDGVDFTGTNICQSITLVPGDAELCATVHYITPDGDTCRVKVNTCLPEVEMNVCTCENPQFQNDVNAGFTHVKNSGLNYTFTPVSLIDNCDMVAWFWGDGSPDGSSSGTNSITHVFPSPGDYFTCMLVTRTDYTGMVCSAEYCINVPITAVNEPTPDKSLIVSPNPSSDYFNITLPASVINSENVLRVSNVQGQLLQTVPISGETVSLDLSDQSAGLYLLALYSKQGNLLALPSKLIKL
ncbi:MAG: T9SS type A sorting domain-containing protein [Saprospiraceae bacterium]|nr:T9SS type A sorting domain-containing protein [Saprospiraceae bacterium]